MLIQYKCPNCGSDMGFDTESGALSCESCGREDNIETFDDDYITRTFTEEEAVEYQCENCGAAVVTDADTTATSCSFCGSSAVIADRLSGDLAPGMVIPFSINKEDAKKAFRKWCKKGRFTPRKFMYANRIKKITGMYVPFWIYDLGSQMKINAVGTKVRTYTRGDYVYTETKYFDIKRDMDIYFNKVPADASVKMNDELMDLLEPFHYKDLKDFKTPYLAGYLAEKYNLDDDALYERVKQKVTPSIRSYAEQTMRGYTKVMKRQDTLHINNLKSTYVLFPVWMVYYDYEQQEHTFAMNGQTGKVVGKPPISKGKLAVWAASIAASSFAVLKVAAFAMGGVLW